MTDPTVLSRAPDLVAIDKPAGWVVHAAMERETHDLRAWLAAAADLPAGLEPLHRLDRDTSGVVLFAADPAVRARVGRWFMQGKVAKHYVVLVQGRAHRKGIIRVPLRPDTGGAPQEAVTRYRLVEALGAFSLLRVTPETGRKHQIRRHLHGLGLPVVGDTRYPAQHPLRMPAYPDRLFLHASHIFLPDERVFESPLPPELLACVTALREGRPARAPRPDPAAPAPVEAPLSGNLDGADTSS